MKIFTMLLLPSLLCAAAAQTTPPSVAQEKTDNVVAAFAPYFSDDFEAAKPGARLAAPYDAAARSRISDEKARNGKQSVRMEIRAGDRGGYGQWGATLPIRPHLTKGQEIWIRLYVLWPQEFQFSAQPWMKFLRLHTRSADGKNRGYNDLYVDRANGTKSVLRTIKEMHDKWAVYHGPAIPREQWERYEMYLYLDDIPANAGGKGRVRIWRDGKLIFNRGDVPTISEATDSLDYFYLFTYWNNEMPPDNHCFVDDLAIATGASPPTQRDDDGLLMIGDWTRR